MFWHALGDVQLAILAVLLLSASLAKVVRLLRGGKGVAVKADATTTGQLRFYPIASEIRGVVANLIDLVGARSFDVGRVKRAGDGSDENVSILALCAAEVKMREAEDDAVAGITKPRAAAIESFHVGTDLHEAKRDCSADERIATPVDANERIYIPRVVAGGFSRSLLCPDRLPYDRRNEQKSAE